jgi:SAM-dependent MidA family methyltransferase
MTPLPPPSFEAQAHSAQLIEKIQQAIQAQSGWISFATFMEMALYTPALGYYAGGLAKFGEGGDFVTAPEISALFGQTLANQIAEILPQTEKNILELGAGSGKLAQDILLRLADGNIYPQYFILEVSNHLRAVQQERLRKNLPENIFQKICWLDALPENFSGVIVANEVLDALPVHIVRQTQEGIAERGIAEKNGELVWQEQWLATLNQPGELVEEANLSGVKRQLLSQAIQQNLPIGMETEFCPAASGLMHSLSQTLQQGAILLIDYGFSAREYYHPQRGQGTLMCHYRHYAHDDPLKFVGLQDITAHVNFTQIAQAGVESGLTLSGFTSQAQFLMNCGVLQLMQKVSPDDIAQYAPMAAAVQKLLSPAEMGELFKVIGFCKNIEAALLGFMQGDKTHTL